MKRVVFEGADTQDSLRPFATSVKETVVNRAEGMFLWLRLVLEELKVIRTEDDFQRTLEKIPSGLEQYSDRFLSRLNLAATPAERSHIELVFQWAAFSASTATEENIKHALDIRFGSGPGRPIFPILMKRCSPLLQCLSGGRIHVLHLSVRDYLRTKRGSIFGDSDLDSVSAGHTALFRICMQYLSTTIGDEVNFSKARRDLAKKYSLFEYAARHVWAHLFESRPPNGAKIDLLEEFFEKAGKNLLWVETTCLLGIDYRLRDQLIIQSDLQNWLKEYKPVSASDASKIKRIESGLRSLYTSAVGFSKNKYGRRDVRTAKAIHALSSFLYYNRHIKESLSYLIQSLSRYETSMSFDPYDPDYLVLLAELASCQFDIDPLDSKCVENMSRAYEGSKVVNGSNHPTTLHNGIILADI
ncbi:hypothetical protein AOQ84DRAFT_406001 [Glonium stellatum]|uniref:Uncharacterized protein n=1 Tax=Glonium stellatum TaxID=574774 RepID=A0A8E2JYL8_9PEZI|nr:hypothetical protein AOQ84DRAFT_406001 [Glonium stellatum]